MLGPRELIAPYLSRDQARASLPRTMMQNVRERRSVGGITLLAQQNLFEHGGFNLRGGISERNKQKRKWIERVPHSSRSKYIDTETESESESDHICMSEFQEG